MKATPEELAQAIEEMEALDLDDRTNSCGTPCLHCRSKRTKKFGRTRIGVQRYRCHDCAKTFSFGVGMFNPATMCRLDDIIDGFERGLSIRQLEGLTGLNRTTVWRVIQTWTAPARRQCGCGRPRTHRGMCMWRRQHATRLNA